MFSNSPWANQWWVCIDSDNGLVTADKTPLHAQIVTKIYDAIMV